MGSWKTTLIGAILAIVIAVAPILQTGVINWKDVAIAVLVALAAYFTKDKNVTGGDVSNGLKVKK
jgi:hypothetical protein